MKVGLDVGSTTIKCVVLDDADNLVYSTYERHYSHILEKSEELLRRVAAGAMACALVAVLVVTGHSVQSERVVNVCSWGEYIDEDLITRFEEQTGIRVNYQTAESNEALYSLIKMGGADFDVIVPSDYMIARLIQEDMLAELDYSHIPNFQLIDDTYKNLSYDPENKYTVPYTWGTLGIIYNLSLIHI